MFRPQDANHRPYSSQWNLTVERELPHNFFFSASYVGTKGTHLPSQKSPINVINPYNGQYQQLASKSFTTYVQGVPTTVDTVLKADYNAVQTTDQYGLEGYNGPTVFAAAGVKRARPEPLVTLMVAPIPLRLLLRPRRSNMIQ
jgi:hypothetical protein